MSEDIIEMHKLLHLSYLLEHFLTHLHYLNQSFSESVVDLLL